MSVVKPPERIDAVTDAHGLEPVSRESTASIIARKLRTAIMYGSFPPGSQMGEADLAARLGVSRGPLREAMQRLIQEGLLRSERNRGLFVVTLQPDDVRDVYIARSAIERAAVSLILRRSPGSAAGRLAEVLDEMSTAAAGRDETALSDADLRFHEELVSQSGSVRLIRMHQTLLVETRMCMTELQGTYRNPDELVDEHAAIVTGLRGGDEHRLLHHVDVHMSEALDRLAPDDDAAGDAAEGTAGTDDAPGS